MIRHPSLHAADAQFLYAEDLAVPVARGLLSIEAAIAAVYPTALARCPDFPNLLLSWLNWTIRDSAREQEFRDADADRDISRAISGLLAKRAAMREVGEAALRVNADRLQRHTVRAIIERETAWWVRLNAEAA